LKENEERNRMRILLLKVKPTAEAHFPNRDRQDEDLGEAAVVAMMVDKIKIF
jgi:hypothetical protein